ncbi:hypothetical protein D3C85_838480 [compost metagenome]
MPQLIAQPPAIERYADCAAALNGDKSHQPGRLVAHGDGHSITLAHAKALYQLASQTVDLLEKLSESQALLLPDHELAIAVLTAYLDCLQKVARRLAKVARALFWCHHLKWRAWRNQLLPGTAPLFNTHLLVLRICQRCNAIARLRRRPSTRLRHTTR